jgi:hypothetical protein
MLVRVQNTFVVNGLYAIFPQRSLGKNLESLSVTSLHYTQNNHAAIAEYAMGKS